MASNYLYLFINAVDFASNESANVPTSLSVEGKVIVFERITAGYMLENTMDTRKGINLKKKTNVLFIFEYEMMKEWMIAWMDGS